MVLSIKRLSLLQLVVDVTTFGIKINYDTLFLMSSAKICKLWGQIMQNKDLL